LVPLLHAEESRFAQFEGEFTDFIDVEALGIRLGALRTALELYGVIGAGAAHEDTRRQGVDVFVIDIPRPGDGYASDDAVYVSPVKQESNSNKPKKELPPEDPRPKD
jgi:hypothetical protein